MIINAIEHNDYCLCDANGRMLELCFWCDTNTGRALHYEKTADGIAYTEGREPKVVEKYHPMPITYIKKIHCDLEPNTN